MKFIINYSYNLPYENKQDGGKDTQLDTQRSSLDLQFSPPNSKSGSVSNAENIKPKPKPFVLQVIPAKNTQEAKTKKEVKPEDEVSKVNKIDQSRITGLGAELKKLNEPKPETKSFNPNDVHGDKTEDQRKEKFNEFKGIVEKMMKSRQPDSSSKDNSQVNKLKMSTFDNLQANQSTNLDTYSKMLKAGVVGPAVRQKMTAEGISPEQIDNFFKSPPKVTSNSIPVSVPTTSSISKEDISKLIDSQNETNKQMLSQQKEQIDIITKYIKDMNENKVKEVEVEPVVEKKVEVEPVEEEKVEVIQQDPVIKTLRRNPLVDEGYGILGLMSSNMELDDSLKYRFPYLYSKHEYLMQEEIDLLNIPSKINIPVYKKYPENTGCEYIFSMTSFDIDQSYRNVIDPFNELKYKSNNENMKKNEFGYLDSLNFCKGLKSETAIGKRFCKILKHSDTIKLSAKYFNRIINYFTFWYYLSLTTNSNKNIFPEANSSLFKSDNGKELFYVGKNNKRQNIWFTLNGNFMDQNMTNHYILNFNVRENYFNFTDHQSGGSQEIKHENKYFNEIFNEILSNKIIGKQVNSTYYKKEPSSYVEKNLDLTFNNFEVKNPFVKSNDNRFKTIYLGLYGVENLISITDQMLPLIRARKYYKLWDVISKAHAGEHILPSPTSKLMANKNSDQVIFCGTSICDGNNNFSYIWLCKDGSFRNENDQEFKLKEFKENIVSSNKLISQLKFEKI